MNEELEFPKLPNAVDSFANRMFRALIDKYPKWMLQRTEELIKQSHLLKYAKPGQLWADIGTGKGFIPRFLQEHGVKMVSFDMYDMPTQAIRKKQKGTFAIADATQPPFQHNVFDGASLFLILHHIPAEKHHAVIKGIFDILKPGAKLVMVEDEKPKTTKQNLWTRFNDAFLNALNVEIIREHSYRSNDEWLELFKAAGFQLVENVQFSRSDIGLNISHPVFVFQKPQLYS